MGHLSPQDLGVSSEVSLNKYLPSTYCVPGAVLGTRAQHGGKVPLWGSQGSSGSRESRGRGTRRQTGRALGLDGDNGERKSGLRHRFKKVLKEVGKGASCMTVKTSIPQGGYSKTKSLKQTHVWGFGVTRRPPGFRGDG